MKVNLGDISHLISTLLLKLKVLTAVLSVPIKGAIPFVPLKSHATPHAFSIRHATVLYSFSRSRQTDLQTDNPTDTNLHFPPGFIVRGEARGPLTRIIH